MSILVERSIKKWSGCILFSILVLCFCSACAVKPNTDKPPVNQTVGGEVKVKLTQRQIDILTEVGLPTDYAELSDSQQNDIVAIEEMLCYMEDTYKTTVVYRNFTQASPLNDESLVVIINEKEVTVSRRYESGKYVYTDNYDAIFSTEKYEEVIKAFFVEKGIEAKVYAEISKLENGTDDVLSSANAAVFVFVCGDYTRIDFEHLVSDYGTWYAAKSNGVENATRFYAVSKFDYLDIGRSNYYDCLQEVSDENRLICIISPDGSVSVK